MKQAYWHCNASKWHCDPHIGKLGMRKWTAQYAQVPISTSRSRQRVGIVSVCLMRLLATWSATMLRYSLQDQFPRSTHTPHFPCESSLITFPPPSRPVAATTEDDLSNGVSGKAFLTEKWTRAAVPYACFLIWVSVNSMLGRWIGCIWDIVILSDIVRSQMALLSMALAVTKHS